MCQPCSWAYTQFYCYCTYVKLCMRMNRVTSWAISFSSHKHLHVIKYILNQNIKWIRLDKKNVSHHRQPMGGVEEKTALEHSRHRTAVCCPCSIQVQEGKLKSPRLNGRDVSQSLVQIKNLNSGTKVGWEVGMRAGQWTHPQKGEAFQLRLSMVLGAQTLLISWKHLNIWWELQLDLHLKGNKSN